jgi:hypothetical protein
VVIVHRRSQGSSMLIKNVIEERQLLRHSHWTWNNISQNAVVLFDSELEDSNRPKQKAHHYVLRGNMFMSWEIKGCLHIRNVWNDELKHLHYASTTCLHRPRTTKIDNRAPLTNWSHLADALEVLFSCQTVRPSERNRKRKLIMWLQSDTCMRSAIVPFSFEINCFAPLTWVCKRLPTIRQSQHLFRGNWL